MSDDAVPPVTVPLGAGGRPPTSGPPAPPGGAPSGAPVATAVRPGPAVALPREPGRWDVAITGFWRAGTVPLGRWRLGAVAAVGLLGGAAVVGHQIGLGVSIVGLGVLATAAPAMLHRRAVGDLLTLALSGALLVMVSVRAAEWVVVLCLLAAVGAATAALTAARRPSAVLLAPLVAGLGTLRALPSVRRSLGALAGSRRESVLVAVRSLVVTALLVGVFGALFASADAVFRAFLPRVDIGLLPGQAIVGILVAMLAAGAAHLSLVPAPWPAAPDEATRRRVRPEEWYLPVVALDVVVVAFVLVQIGALIGGHAFVQRTAGMTYAGYAREGFGQLVAVTVLTLAVVALAARWAPRVSATHRRWSSLALGVLCLGTLGVVASAVRRMALYVDAFGLTRLRITVLVAEIALGVVFLLVIAAGVRWRGAWLPRAAVQVAAVAVLALALMNPDALIVHRNGNLSLAGDGSAHGLVNGVDVSYLRGLSADAVPAVVGLPEPVRTAVLGQRTAPTADGWAGWNLARSRAADVLDELGSSTP